jgi:hypothetical protein
MKKMRFTVIGDDSVALIERLCTATGLNPPSLVALLIRRYGKDLEQWVGYSSSPASGQTTSPPEIKRQPLELPTNPGEGLTPVEL